MICNIPGRIFYGSDHFGLSSLHDDYGGFAGEITYLKIFY
jgi:hypothetical protein